MSATYFGPRSNGDCAANRESRRFWAAFQDVLNRVPTTHGVELASLLTRNFQEFDAVSLLTA